MENTIEINDVLDYILLKLWYADRVNDIETFDVDWKMRRAASYRSEAETLERMLVSLIGKGDITVKYRGAEMSRQWVTALKMREEFFVPPGRERT